VEASKPVTASHPEWSESCTITTESSTRKNKELAWQTIAAKIWQKTNRLPKQEEFTFTYED
jgi:hypothetical protein